MIRVFILDIKDSFNCGYFIDNKLFVVLCAILNALFIHVFDLNFIGNKIQNLVL